MNGPTPAPLPVARQALYAEVRFKIDASHAMLIGLMAARNIMGASYNLWRINADALYLEEGEAASESGRLYPHPLTATITTGSD